MSYQPADKDYPESECIERKQPCLNPKCGSSDAMEIYQEVESGKQNAYCWSCKTFFTEAQLNGTIEKPMLTQRPQKDYSSDLDRISKLPCDAMPDRNISKAAAEYYGVRTEYSETTREPLYRYFPYHKDGILVAYKRKNLQKKDDQIWIGDGKKAELFGMNTVKGTKFMIITEGEEDALAARDMLKSNGKAWNVTSLPSGANVNGIKTCYKALYAFTQLNLAFDNDKVGKKAASEAAKLFDPGQIKVTEFKTHKDSNEFLVARDQKGWMNDIYNAVTRKPDGIVTISDIWDEAIRRPTRGIPWMWDTLTEATYGIRPGELYGIGAGTGVFTSAM